MSCLALPVLAAPPGRNVTKEAVDGCELSLGPAEADGGVPMRAECTWPDVTLDRFKSALLATGDHDAYWSVVVHSDVRRTEDGRDLVWQQHHSRAISDRQGLGEGARGLRGGPRQAQERRPRRITSAPALKPD